MELTQELVKELFEYKEEGLYWKIKPATRVQNGDRFGHIGVKGYRKGTIKNKTYTEHRLIFLYHHGYLPKLVDHVNGNKSDNRIENLREASWKQNLRNSKRSKRNTSGHKGVSWIASRKRWQVTIMTDYSNSFKGYFKDFELACLVADEARDLYYKEFARNG